MRRVVIRVERLARQELEVQRLRRQHTSDSIRVPASIGTLPPARSSVSGER